MSKYVIKLQLPSGEWVPAFYPAYVYPPVVNTRDAADQLAMVIDAHWKAEPIEGTPKYYRIEEVDE